MSFSTAYADPVAKVVENSASGAFRRYKFRGRTVEGKSTSVVYETSRPEPALATNEVRKCCFPAWTCWEVQAEEDPPLFRRLVRSEWSSGRYRGPSQGSSRWRPCTKA